MTDESGNSKTDESGNSKTDKSGNLMPDRLKYSMFAINAGLVANFFLAVIKTATGILGNSSALLADGINSTADVAYGIVISIMVKISGKPADDEHPYGHEQMESVAAVVVGAFVITTAIGIFWKSINTTYRLWCDGGATGFRRWQNASSAETVFCVGADG